MIAKRKILLIGNCVLDQVWDLEYFPQQDEEMRAQGCSRALGGNACNSAQILAKLGNEVELVSSLADDDAADWILQQLSTLSVLTEYCVQRSGSRTAQSCIWLNAQNGSRTIAHYRDLAELTINELSSIPVLQYHWIHFEGRNIEALTVYLPRLIKSNVSISLEIEKDRAGIEDLLPFVDTVIVSSSYLKSKKLSVAQCLKRFKRINPTLNIVCTLGEDGVLGQDSVGNNINVMAEPVEKVVDTVGAGDCFIAGLIHHLNQQHDFASAVVYANQLAAQKIQYKGLRLNEE